jgi:hypothetical protein
VPYAFKVPPGARLTLADHDPDRHDGLDRDAAAEKLAEGGPAVLLAEHLDGPSPILVYRVADFRAAVDELRARGVRGGEELEIPHGPCFGFKGPGGQRLAVYELVRPEADAHFAGRIDP